MVASASGRMRRLTDVHLCEWLTAPRNGSPRHADDNQGDIR